MAGVPWCLELARSVVVHMTGDRPIGSVDTMWLTMDRPNNLTVIDSIMWFEEPVHWNGWPR